MCTSLLLALHLMTYHFGNHTTWSRGQAVPQSELNAETFGAGVECDTGDRWSTEVGVYNNSYRHAAVYAAEGIRWGRVGVFAGLATGYTYPFIAGATLDYGPARVVLVPDPHNPALHLMLRFKL